MNKVWRFDLMSKLIYKLKKINIFIRRNSTDIFYLYYYWQFVHKNPITSQWRNLKLWAINYFHFLNLQNELFLFISHRFSTSYLPEKNLQCIVDSRLRHCLKLFVIMLRCPWCSRYRRRKWTRRHEFKSWMSLIAFHIALIPLGKVWIQLFSLQLWVNSRTD